MRLKRRYFNRRRLNLNSEKKPKNRISVFWRWIVIILFTILGPLAIIFFKTPGKKPSLLPILTVTHQISKPLPIEIQLDEKFNTQITLDLAPLNDSIFKRLNVMLPEGSSDVLIVNRDKQTNLQENSNTYLFKKYETGQIQFNIESDSLNNLLYQLSKDEPFNARIVFKLSNTIINHSYSNKSLILFYLPMAGGDAANQEKVHIGLKTPIDFILNSSVPDIERILPFSEYIYYDFESSSSDSGLLFNFNDTSKSILEEITMFIISTVFGFFSGLILEKGLFRKLTKEIDKGS